ncbi:putative membrane protein [Allocatelliglobosispora scoriae]|uniref:Putative membrane protein n=1 Tax=Allocatelliglobosispora scoriae TaxID=643052 RepID=A0A841BIK7_9ACTN|nr:DUF2238 domain-containing protein [Allocatelliglobosispora scoriae]MBB5867158.1 putative membrane protein [Allocatelliglobosispora scoriae]
MSLPRGHRIALAVFLALLAVSWWRPIYPTEQALHHSLTAVALVGLVYAQHRLRLPLSSFVLALVFLTLHTVAARWIYSFVPYDEWARHLTGSTLSARFGWERNHFDRLVHFAYGLLLAPILMRVLMDRGRATVSSAVSAINVVLSTGALYELFEWGIAIALAPGMAEAYNGQQGDIWDAQKDMGLAFAGSIIGAVICALLAKRRHRLISENH